MTVKWLTVCLLATFSLVYCNNSNDVALQKLLHALEKLIGYYSTNYRDMNLDGIYGLRVLEGQITVILNNTLGSTTQNIPSLTRKRLQRMLRNTQRTGNAALVYVEADDASYYKQVKPLVEKSMSYTKLYQTVDLTLEWHQKPPHKRSRDFSEEFSDDCMSQLMGSGQYLDKKCNPSKKCLNAMLARGLNEYGITHQLLYTMLAEQNNCEDVLEAYLDTQGRPGGLQQLQLEFCSNNFLEMQTQLLQLDGRVLPVYQDLFMEQEFVCPVMGFMEFLHVDWLEQILSWQDQETGCFGKMGPGENQGGADYAYVEDKSNNVKESIVRENRLDAKNDNQQVVMQQRENALVLVSTNRSRPRDDKAGNQQADQPLVWHDKNAFVADKHGEEFAENINQDSQEKDPPRSAGVADESIHRARQGHLQLEGGAHSKWDHVQLRQDDHQTGYLGQQRKLLSYHGHRKLLVEKDLDGGCLAHKTAVAAGALSQYLRLLLDPGPSQYQSVVQVAGINHLMVLRKEINAENVYKNKPIVSAERDQPQQGKSILNPAVFKRAQIPGPAHGDDQPEKYEYEEDKENEEDMEEDEGDEEDDEGEDDMSKDYYDKDQDGGHKAGMPPFLNRRGNDARQDGVWRRGHKHLGEDGDKQVGDKEYEQYIDNNEDDEQDQVKEDADIFKGPVKGQPGAMESEKEVNDDGDLYNYYDKDDEARGALKNAVKHLPLSGKKHIAAKMHTRAHPKMADPAANREVGRTYVLVLIAMVVLLVILYKFVRRRRIFIRYRYR